MLRGDRNSDHRVHLRAGLCCGQVNPCSELGCGGSGVVTNTVHHGMASPRRFLPVTSPGSAHSPYSSHWGEEEELSLGYVIHPRLWSKTTE